MNWFEKMKSGILTRIRRDIPAGIWTKCNHCGETTYHSALARSHWVCPRCDSHLLMGHQKYVDLLVDSGTFEEIDAHISTADPLKFRDHRRYTDRIKEGRRASQMNEAIFTGVCTIGGHRVALGIMDTRFILGSMGGATGEKITRLVIRAIADRRTLILVCQSGGARMQESAYSLMQMAKTCSALADFSEGGGFSICVMANPTTGGVTASYAMLGDVQIAEPNALICFAGPRVIEQTIREKLPEGFQRAEYLLDHGMLDRVTKRTEMRDELITITRMLMGLPPAVRGDLPAPEEVEVAEAAAAVQAAAELPVDTPKKK